MISQALIATVPYPYIDEASVLHNGLHLELPPKCLKCKTLSCNAFRSKDIGRNGVAHLVCERHVSVFKIAFPTATVLVVGVLEPNLNESCPSDLRKMLRAQRVSFTKVEAWRAAVMSVMKELDKETAKRDSDAMAGLHDVKAATSVILRNAEALLRDEPGTNDKLENASEPLKALYKSVLLLNGRLQATGYVANPESISLGRKRPRSLYMQIDSICRMFREMASKKSVSITVSGSSIKKVALYDSFDALTMSLIDNAVKYSFNGNEVRVLVTDLPNAILVRISSTGFVVPESERTRIFERGYRTESAKKVTAEGHGLGLYTARLIADAHDFVIRYESQPMVGMTADRGINIFSFEITC